jgi:hypothetical protein
MPIFKTRPENLWKWFGHYKAELFEFEPNDVAARDKLFNSIVAAVHRVDRDLTFKIGPKGPKREFVISAGGSSAHSLPCLRCSDALPEKSVGRSQLFVHAGCRST